MTELVHVALKCFFKFRCRKKVIENTAMAWAATVSVEEQISGISTFI